MRLSNFMGIPLCLALISTGAFAGPGPSPSPTPKPSPSPTPIPPKPTPTPMPSPSPSPSPIPKKSPLTTVTENKEKGLKILADSIGKTLYVFDLDRNRKKPACTGTCAEVWPPYLLSDSETADLKAPLGTIKRINKKTQLTYNGRPVYTYAFDRIQGDQLGDGVAKSWHVIEIK